MKKICSALLALVLTLTLSLPALAADTATTLRLTVTEGDVTLGNQNGRTLTIREDMKLYSGYTVATGKASYAYISLDGTKAVKLDASTTVEIRKSGKQLQVLLSAGKLLFDVKEPLKSDESLEIRTSTVVTGIRGTVGIMEHTQGSAPVSTVKLMEGSVVVRAVNQQTGQQTSAPLEAGQSATVTLPTPTQTGSAAPLVQVESLTPQSLPPFVIKEIAKDTSLQARIDTQLQTKLELPERLGSADALLKQEEQAAQTVLDSIEKEQIEQSRQDTPAPTLPPATSDTSTTPTPPTPPTPPPTSSQELSGAVTADVLTAALSANQTVTLTSGATLNLTSGALAVPASRQLVLSGGACMNLTGTARLQIQGTITNAGTVAMSAGTVHVGTGGTWTNTGTLTLSGGTFEVKGAFHMEGGDVSRTGDDMPVLGADPGTVRFTGGAFQSDCYAPVMDLSAFAAVPGALTPTISESTTDDESSYRLSYGLQAAIDDAGTTPTSITLNQGVAAAANTKINAGQVITLSFQANGKLSLAKPLQNAGTLYLVSEIPVTAVQIDTVNPNSNAIDNRGTLHVGIWVGSTATSGTTIVNSGTLTVAADGKVFGENCAISNSGTGTVTIAGAVSSRMMGIANSSDVNAVTVDGGTVELTRNILNSCAISGPFTFTGGTVRAKSADSVCEADCIPSGYRIADTADGWFALTTA